mgnify:CR=1 FL=1
MGIAKLAIICFLISHLVIIRDNEDTAYVAIVEEAAKNGALFWNKAEAFDVIYIDGTATIRDVVQFAQPDTIYVIGGEYLYGIPLNQRTIIIQDPGSSLLDLSAIIAHELGHIWYNLPDTYHGLSEAGFNSYPCTHDIMCNPWEAYRNSLTIYVPLVLDTR